MKGSAIMTNQCAYCKKIKDDKGNWHQAEADASMQANVVISHGICPECEKEEYGKFEQLYNEIKK
jgi:hypothetical protein